MLPEQQYSKSPDNQKLSAWVRTDQDASPHFVENYLDGKYEAHGPDHAEQSDNRCDAL